MSVKRETEVEIAADPQGRLAGLVIPRYWKRILGVVFFSLAYSLIQGLLGRSVPVDEMMICGYIVTWSLEDSARSET